jgi:hypothetical protein
VVGGDGEESGPVERGAAGIAGDKALNLFNFRRTQARPRGQQHQLHMTRKIAERQHERLPESFGR